MTNPPRLQLAAAKRIREHDCVTCWRVLPPGVWVLSFLTKFEAFCSPGCAGAWARLYGYEVAEGVGVRA